MWLRGFGSKEEESRDGQTVYFRWSGGKESKLTFLGLQAPPRSRLLLDFERQLKSPLSTAAMIVQPGWNSYRAALDFPKGEDLSVTVEY